MLRTSTVYRTLQQEIQRCVNSPQCTEEHDCTGELPILLNELLQAYLEDSHEPLPNIRIEKAVCERTKEALLMIALAEQLDGERSFPKELYNPFVTYSPGSIFYDNNDPDNQYRLDENGTFTQLLKHGAGSAGWASLPQNAVWVVKK